MNKVGKITKIAVVTALLAAPLAARATGTVDTDVQSVMDNYTATFAAVKTVILSVLGFFIALGLVRFGIRKARG